MTTDRPTRLVFADQLTPGDVIFDSYPKPHESVVIDTRVMGDMVTGIVVDEDGEQQPIGYGTNTAVRILARDTAPTPDVEG